VTPFLKLREKYMLTQREVAQKLNVNRATISKWETGKFLPDTKNLINIAKLYNCTIDDLILPNNYNTTQNTLLPQ